MWEHFLENHFLALFGARWGTTWPDLRVPSKFGSRSGHGLQAPRLAWLAELCALAKHLALGGQTQAVYTPFHGPLKHVEKS